MPKTVMDGPKWSEDVLWGFVCGAFLTLVQVALALTSKGHTLWVTVACAAAGALCLLGVLWRVLVVRRTQRWLRLSPTGFTVVTAGRRWELTDDAVTDVELTDAVLETLGKPMVRRTLRVGFWLGERAVRFKFDEWLHEETTDEFGPALLRARTAVERRALAALARGETVKHEDWHLDREAVTTLVPSAEFRVPLARIDTVDYTDGALRVWADGALEPVFELDGERGAGTLHRLLVAVRCAPDTANPARASVWETATTTDAADCPDRLLFRREEAVSRLQYIAEVCALVVIAVLGVLSTRIGLTEPALPSTTAYGLLLLGGLCEVGAVCGAYVYTHRFLCGFRCYARAIEHRLWGRTARLRFRDISALTYSATRTFVNGAPAGTRAVLLFETSDPTKPTIRYVVSFKFNDTELERLRAFVSRVIATRWLGRVRAGMAVEWTPQFVFGPDGLIVKREGGNARVIGYERVGDHEFVEGVFKLSLPGDFGRPITEPVAQRNFFPGFHLLLLLTAAPATSTQ